MFEEEVMGKWNTVSKGNITFKDVGVHIEMKIGGRPETAKELNIRLTYEDFQDLCDIVSIITKEK